jgi:hypothetical protein
VRLLDLKEDLLLIGKLKSDKEGPTDLFEDACWMESHGSRCVPVPTPGERTASM